jgi:cell division protease FtsH
MVTTFGMSKVLGPLAYQQGARPMFLNDGMPNARRAMSEETAQAIDREVKDIVETAHQQALEAIRHNRDLMEAITMQLLETEAIEGKALHQLLDQAQAVPVGV